MIVPDWIWYAQQVLRGAVIVLVITSAITWRWAFRVARAWISDE